MGSIRRAEVVVITGASAGVGRATVRAFARQGAHIGLLARGRAGLEGARRVTGHTARPGRVLAPPRQGNEKRLRSTADLAHKETQRWRRP